MSEYKELSIGLCTFKRKHLIETLKSIFLLQFPKDVVLNEIIVVDNDEDRSAQILLEELIIPFGFKIQYISEPEKNIAVARNQILNNATGEWLAVVDDDEIVSSLWIVEFFKASNSLKAAAYFGPVVPEFPENTPQWIIEGGYFNRRNLNNLSLVETGGSGNSFMHLPTIRSYGHEFSPAYGQTGGEDSYFFYTLFLKGEKLVWVSNAQVTERVEPHRLNETFLCKWRYRVGQTYSRYRYIDDPHVTKQKILKYALQTCLKLLINASKALVFKLLSLVKPSYEQSYFKANLEILDTLGKLSGLKKRKLVSLYG